jgi:sugar phosphate isomerase/epimerase
MPTSYPFPISFCSIGLRHKPAAEALDQIASAGFRGVELWYPHIEKLGEEGQRGVAGQCQKLGLAPTVIAPYFSFTRGEEWRTKSIETARAALKAAAIFQVKKIRTFVDIGPDGLPSDRATEADWAAACAGLRELCDLDRATDFVVETHENTLADSLPTIQRLFQEVDRRNLRLNFQVNADFVKRGHMECLEILYPYIAHMHWEQLREDMTATYIDEPGRVDFTGLIGWLAAKGYRGTASVEYCWDPVDEKRIPSAVRYLDAVIGKLGAKSAG